MATVNDIVKNARVMLRDFARPFSTTVTGNGAKTAFQLQRSLIASAQVIRQTATPQLFVSGVDYTLDTRNGYLTFTVAPSAGVTCYIDGTAYDWFYDADLTYFVNNIVAEHAHNRSDFSFGSLTNSDPETTAITLGTIVEGLWSLLSEVARDIDVHAPEGVSIPASERYAQIRGLLDYYEHEYDKIAEALGVGLERMQMFTLRRVSVYTGRFVPVYVPQEINDTDPADQVFPPIDQGLN